MASSIKQIDTFESLLKKKYISFLNKYCLPLINVQEKCVPYADHLSLWYNNSR